VSERVIAPDTWASSRWALPASIFLLPADFPQRHVKHEGGEQFFDDLAADYLSKVQIYAE
jgi:hypothetical protein